MTDRELLSSISFLLDEKLEPIKFDIAELKINVSRLNEDVTELKVNVSRLNTDVEQLKTGLVKTNLIIENGIKPDIHLLAENYLPLSASYQKLTASQETMAQDIIVLKRVVLEHSEKLSRTS